MVGLLSDMGPEGVAETVQRHPRDAQATPKTAEKLTQSDRKEAKSSPRPPTGSQKIAKKKENCCQEAAEGIEKGAETRKQRNVKIWFS